MKRCVLILLFTAESLLAQGVDTVTIGRVDHKVKNPIINFGAGNTVDFTGATVSGISGDGLGSVTSVAISGPNIFDITGSPVTGSGTLTLSLATQAAHKVWIGPVSGSAAAPTFRLLDVADLPTGTSGTTVPLLDGANTWSATQTGPFLDKGGTVYNAAAYSGADLGAKIQAAHDAMPSTGGVIDARSLTGAQTLSAITLTKPTTILFGHATITASGSLTISGAASVVIEGRGAAATKLTTPDAAPWIVFGSNYADNKNLIHISDLWFTGGTGASQIISDTSTYPSSLNFNESRFLFERCMVSGYASAHPIYLGASFYYNTIQTCRFTGNSYSIRTGRYSDAEIIDCEGISFGQITTFGTNLRIVGSSFVPSGQTTPDILIDAEGTSDGQIWIGPGNKFGAEGEIETRKKIVIQSSTDTSIVVPDVHIFDNKFYAHSTTWGQTAIDLQNPVRALKIQGNTFDGFQYVVNDAQAVSSGGNTGGGIFDGNTVTNKSNSTLAGSVARVFVNGGRGFARIEYIHPETKESVTNEPRSNETLGLINRLARSDAFDNASWTKTGVTTTTGQTDPFGGTTAQKISRAGSAQNESIRATVTTGAVGAMAAMGTRLVVTFWAKAGTASSVEVGLRDTTDVGWCNLTRVPLGSTWKKYKFTCEGLNNAHGFDLYFYPGGSDTPAAASDFYLSRVQVSDFDSDFYPTTGAALSLATAGSRFEKSALFTNGLQVHYAGTALLALTSADQISLAGTATFLTDGSGLLAVDAISWDPSGNFSATSFAGAGSGLTALNASNISSGTINAARLPDLSGTYQPLDGDLTSWASVTRASGFDTFAATPSSANLASLVTDETGSGSLVFGTSPTFTTDFGFATSRFYNPASDTVEMRNAANAQTFNLYNTYTDASNYERGFMRWTTNQLQIGTENAGTGSARAVVFQSASSYNFATGGTVRWGINSGGVLYPNAANTYDIGATTNTVKNIYAAGFISAGRNVVAKTANYTVLAADLNNFFTNAGASGTVNFTLPTAAAGLVYTFYVDAAQTVTITAGASTTIRIAGSVSASAGNITTNTVGNCVTLQAISTTKWVAQSSVGSWTVN